AAVFLSSERNGRSVVHLQESGRPGSNRRRPAWEAFSALVAQGFFGGGSRHGITQYYSHRRTVRRYVRYRSPKVSSSSRTSRRMKPSCRIAKKAMTTRRGERLPRRMPTPATKKTAPRYMGFRLHR